MEILFGIILLLVIFFGFTAFTGAPFVPSFRKELEITFTELYKLGKNDHLVDLGSGNGVVLSEASKLGAKATGIELHPLLVLYSKIRLHKNPLCKTKLGNIFSFQFPEDTTVVYLFGEDRDIIKFAEKIRSESARLNRPLFLISQAFQIPGLKPEKQNRAYFLYEIDANSKFERADK